MAKQTVALAGVQQQILDNPALTAVVVLLFLVTCTDASQIIFVLAGAVAFSLMHMRLPMPTVKPPRRKVVEEPPPRDGRSSPAQRMPPAASPKASPKPVRPWHAAQAAVIHPAAVAARAPETLRPSVQPVAALSIQSTAFSDAVNELVGRVLPDSATGQTLEQLLELIRKEIRQLIPRAEVVGWAASRVDVGSGTAFGVAVPEVDVVVVASPADLAKFIAMGNSPKTDLNKLTKAAIRLFTDRIVATGNFKFRRSNFRSDEPRVNLLATGVKGDPVPISFSVNAISPLYNAVLMFEASRRLPAFRELILLVRRWTKYRAICHSPKGHFSPYHWTLLGIYFMQVKGAEGVPLLPPLGEWGLPTTLEGMSRRCLDESVAADLGLYPSQAATELFKGFLEFYAQDFEVRSEAVCVRLGTRAKPRITLPLHIVEDDKTGATACGWSIEDPLDRKHNLGDVGTFWSMNRLREEIVRAHRISSCAEPSLTEMMELWVPVEEAVLPTGEAA